MIMSVHDWVLFLRHSDTLICFPLFIVGGVLMLFGWRLWRPCVVLAYSLIGAGIGTTLAASDDKQLVLALSCGAILGLASYWPAKQAVAVLGGLIGAGIAWFILEKTNVRGAPLLLVSIAAFVLSTALAFSNRRLVIIGVTAALGAVLAISGLTALIMASPTAYGTFSSLAGRSVLVVLFMLMVPAIMSCFYQVSEVHRIGNEI
jgi:hypothetical protein